MIRFGTLTGNVFWRFGYIGVRYKSFVINFYVNSVSKTSIYPPWCWWFYLKCKTVKDFTITTTSGLRKDQKKKKKNRIAQTIYQQLARFRLAKLTLFRSKMLLININTVKKFEIKGKYRNILWGLWKDVSNSNTISFSLYRACFTHLSSSNLSCNLRLWYYDQLVLF